MKPKNYKEQKACANCKFAFRRVEYDEGFQYYCTVNDKMPRPQCGSIALNEGFKYDTSKRWGGCPELTTWDNWAKKRVVLPWGICPNWEKINVSKIRKNI